MIANQIVTHMSMKIIYPNFMYQQQADKFISNKNAEEKIKEENVDYFIKVFINNLNNSKFDCNDKNNIEILEKFLSSEKNKTLLINQVSDEIYFYEFVLREFSISIKLKFITIDFTGTNENGNVWKQNIHVIKTNVSKNIECSIETKNNF